MRRRTARARRRRADGVESVLVPADERGALGRTLGGLFGQTRERGVSTAFEGRGLQTDEALVLSIDTSGQPPGLYVLALRLRDRATGSTAEAEREITLE